MSCSMVAPIAITVGSNATTTVAASSAPNYNPATNYADGFVVIDPATRIEYESLQNSNTGHALTEVLWWLPLGIENRSKMFDKSIGTQTTAADEISVTLDLQKVVTTIALLNILGTEVQIIVNDPIEGEILNQTIDTTEPSGRSWWKWHFTPINRRDKILFEGLPAYSQATITIKIKNPGATAKCGILLIGNRVILGETQYGASVGMYDYSVKKKDDFGGYIISERPYSDIGRFQVFVNDTMYDRISQLLAKRRAQETLYIGESTLQSTWIYGFFERFENVFSEYGVSDCNLEVESVT